MVKMSAKSVNAARKDAVNNSIKFDPSGYILSPEKIKQIKGIGNKEPIIYIGMGTCGLAGGAGETYKAFQAELEKNNIKAGLVKVGCIGNCHDEPIVDIKMPGKTRLVFKKITSDKVERLVKEMIIERKIPSDLVFGQYISNEDQNYPNIIEVAKTPFFAKQVKFVTSRCGIVNYEALDDYLAYEDGYKALINVLKENIPDKVIERIKISGLRGRGGAGFPTATKWDLCRKATSPDGQKYIIMNFDEGDPGAFMNRTLLEADPFCAIEGLSIMAFAIGASKGYIYGRAEYPVALENLQRAMDIAYERGLLGKNIMGSEFSFDLELKMGAGAFVCGEETALMESIEGKRGMPRIKPPFPATYGLWGRPTTINNVETISQIPKLLNFGAENYAKLGIKTSTGTKAFSLTGKITRPGLVEVPLGITIKEMIEIGGGILNGKNFKAVQIGGPSGGCVPANLINTQIDYDSLKAVGAIVGSGGIVVMDEETCMVDTARYFMSFIKNESCGKCIPCREGTMRLLETLEKLVKKPKNDKEAVDRMKSMIYFERLAEVIKDSALCGLGQTASNPVMSTLRYFKEEYEEHLYEEHCRAKSCQGLIEFKIDVKKCVGCGLCKINCPVNAIFGEKKAPHYINPDKCISCGLCYQNCKFDAINKE
jgi:NADH:ubiquinone oxidoreductase subunit F (NADH-binding)/(2Fe-2S) ferredoxin